MTTAVTVKYANTPVFVYQATLNEELDGEFELVATITEGEKTFYVHSTQDILVSENELD